MRDVVKRAENLKWKWSSTCWYGSKKWTIAPQCGTREKDDGTWDDKKPDGQTTSEPEREVNGREWHKTENSWLPNAKSDEITKPGDESWVHHFDPENKRSSMEFHHKGSSAPKKFKAVPSTGKLMLTVFWDIQGVVHMEFMPKGTTINSVSKEHPALRLMNLISAVVSLCSSAFLIVHASLPSVHILKLVLTKSSYHIQQLRKLPNDQQNGDSFGQHMKAPQENVGAADF
ncbi:hypothetical protein ANN_15832 [Periplaneta americana]|uniref:Uncharacterized protein n=1 Tax=Periplaneta americana TaxID=6978 RepID=A0ABQ8SHR5_PERAM|nr:hypothetical protein ANN_15832 [Periplaneta americana]